MEGRGGGGGGGGGGVRPQTPNRFVGAPPPDPLEVSDEVRLFAACQTNNEPKQASNL